MTRAPVPHTLGFTMRLSFLQLALTTLTLCAFAYTTYFAHSLESGRDLLALLVIAILALITLIVGSQPQDRRVTMGALINNWPLHAYSLAAVAITILVHPDRLSFQLIAYVIVAYATYLAVPLTFIRHPALLFHWARIIAITSAAFAIPSYAGALGLDSFIGLPIYTKTAYAGFTGVAASAGIMEHLNPFAAQMGVGTLCAWYVYRKTNAALYLVLFVLIVGALVISQGRGAWLGSLAALGACLAPRFVREKSSILLAYGIGAAALPFLLVGTLQAAPIVGDALRLSAGLSGREGGWLFALLQISQEPWVGHGFQAAGETTTAYAESLDQIGFHAAGASFHNTFLTKAVEFGLPIAAVYLLLFLRPIIQIAGRTRWPSERALVRSMCLLALTASLYVDINVGGVRSIAIFNAAFLGLANLWPVLEASLSTHMNESRSG